MVALERIEDAAVNTAVCFVSGVGNTREEKVGPYMNGTDDQLERIEFTKQPLERSEKLPPLFLEITLATMGVRYAAGLVS